MALISLILLPVLLEAFTPLIYRYSRSSHLYLTGKKKPFAPDFFDGYDDENGLHVMNRLGFTTENWDDMDDAQDAFDMLVESGISFVSCTTGKESMLGKAIRKQDLKVTVATTYQARFQVRGEASVVSHMESILDTMKIKEVEIVQARPSKLSLVGLAGIADGIRSCVDEGYCTYGGGAMDITNPGKIRSLCRKMEDRDEALITNQFEFNLINRKNEGMIQVCKDLGVIPLIRFPLGKDLLASGRWTSEDPNGIDKSGPRFSYKVLEKWEPLHSMLYRITEKVQGRASLPVRDLKDYRARRYEENKKKGSIVTPAQVAIHYVVAKGGVPLLDVHDPATAEELLGCLGWRLNDEEVRMLDQAAELSSM
jgi:aryl-alcohol dehydrogenase-like predicted oxidoreductase